MDKKITTFQECKDCKFFICKCPKPSVVKKIKATIKNIEVVERERDENDNP